MFNTSFSFLNVCFSSFFNVLNVEGATFDDFLNLLKNVCSLFLNTFLKFCDLLLDNWFVLVLLGFGLFVSVIWLVFDLFNLSNTNSKNTSFHGVLSALPFSFLHDNIDDYLDKKADEKNAIRQLAEKELIMRQNRTQVYDPDSNSIVNVADSSFVENLRFRNYKNYNYGIVTGFILKRSNTPDLPSWFGKIIEPVPASVEEQEQMKKDLEVISND